MAMEDLVHAANGPRCSFAEEMIPLLENFVRVCAGEGPMREAGERHVRPPRPRKCQF